MGYKLKSFDAVNRSIKRKNDSWALILGVILIIIGIIVFVHG